MGRLILTFCLICSPLLTGIVHAAPAKAPYRGAIVIDAESGKDLFASDAEVQSPPASMTKLMTFLLVHDALKAGTLKLDTPVPVTADDSKIGGTQVYLDPRETFGVEELLYALMIQSANDAAHALARAASPDGTVETFVQAMNARAKDLGMTHTVWRSPHGLPPANRKIADGDLSTPRDMAVLSRELLLHTDVLKYCSVRIRNFGEGTRQKPQQMVNHNHLLGKVAGVDGLKTGFTNGAGYCLAATAERGGRRVIVVSMGSPASKTRDLEVTGMIDQGFKLMPPDSRWTGPTLNDVVPVATIDTSTTIPAKDAAGASSNGPHLTPAPLPPIQKPSAPPTSDDQQPLHVPGL